MDAIRGVAAGIESMSILQILLFALSFGAAHVSWSIVMKMYSKRTGRPTRPHSHSYFFSYNFNWKEWLVLASGAVAFFSIGIFATGL